MYFPNLQLTSVGRQLLVDVIGDGSTLTFSRLALGDGTPVGQIADLTDLANEKSSITIIDTDTGEGAISLKGELLNSSLVTGYLASELGVFALDEDNNEVLYAYSYNDVNPTYIPAGSEAYQRLTLTVVVAIGDAENVDAVIGQSIGYVTDAEFSEHTEDTNNPHGVTAAQVGLGNVENVAVNNMAPTYTDADSLTNLSSGETLKVAFGKIRKAIASLITHIGNTNNPHNVTRAQVGLGNVPNVSTDNQTPTFTEASTLANIASGETLKIGFGKIQKAISTLMSHLSANNPHNISLDDLGGVTFDGVFKTKGYWPPTTTGGFVVTGITFTRYDASGAPPATNTDVIVVISLNGGRSESEDYSQIGFVFDGNGGKVYVRFRSLTNGTWTAWK